MRRRLTWILFIAANSLLAQSYVNLRGKVFDQKSKQPLPLATISIKNFSLGTRTNNAGEFELYIPADLKNDTLLVSYIGHETFKEKISDFMDSKIIFLEETSIQLNDVTVTADGARKLVEQALRAIPLVFPTQSYLIKGFHRSWEKMESDSGSYPGTLIEAAVTVYDQGYLPKKNGKRPKEEIYLNEIRRSCLGSGWDYSGNGLRDLFNRNLVKYCRATAFIFLKSFLEFPNNLIYEWEGTTKMDDEDMAIVRVEIPNAQKFPVYYKIYISEMDNAILRFDVVGQKNNIDYSIGPWHTDNLFETYIFKRFQKRPYLSYCKIQYTIKKLDPMRKRILRTENYYREFQVNNVVTQDVEERRKALATRKAKEKSLALQSNAYNEDFWKSYNMILENPLDKEIVK